MLSTSCERRASIFCRLQRFSLSSLSSVVVLSSCISCGRIDRVLAKSCFQSGNDMMASLTGLGEQQDSSLMLQLTSSWLQSFIDSVQHNDGSYTHIAGPKIVCFLTQSVQLTLSSVQLTLLECVMWSSKMSWNRGKNEQICTVKFQNFLGPMPPDPHTGEGLRRPSQPSPPHPPRHSGASRLRASSLSMCSWHFNIF